jgi:hypothetical protein
MTTEADDLFQQFHIADPKDMLASLNVLLESNPTKLWEFRSGVRLGAVYGSGNKTEQKSVLRDGDDGAWFPCMIGTRFPNDTATELVPVICCSLLLGVFVCPLAGS